VFVPILTAPQDHYRNEVIFLYFRAELEYLKASVMEVSGCSRIQKEMKGSRSEIGGLVCTATPPKLPACDQIQASLDYLATYSTTSFMKLRTFVSFLSIELIKNSVSGTGSTTSTSMSRDCIFQDETTFKDRVESLISIHDML
jgi:hypothetical protein